MAILETTDGEEIYYKDWGKGQPIVFSHGWPLTADAWDAQMLFLVDNGYRCIAHDRRGHGRSSQPSTGNDMNTYADDLAQVVKALDLNDAIHVGHSTGGGEVARYLGRHGTERVAKAVFISSVCPHLAKSATNPNGVPMDIFDMLRRQTSGDRALFYQQLAMPFFGFNRPGAAISQTTIDSFWLQSMTGGLINQYHCIKAYSETDFTDDLTGLHIPALVLHGDDDQIVPFNVSGIFTAKLVKNATLKIIPGAPHGMPITLADTINQELLKFFRS